MRKSPERRKIEKERKKEIDYTQEGLTGLEIEERVDVKESVFPKSEKIKAKEVVTGQNAFEEAKFCWVESVKAGMSAFSGAENCEAKYVKAKSDAFSLAQNCKAEKVEAGITAFPNAENCEAKYVKAGRDAFSMAQNCKVEKVEARVSAFPGAENCEAREVKSEEVDAFDSAKKCLVQKVEANWYAFNRAEKCLITEKVKAEEIGRDSLGVVVLGEAEGEVFLPVILMKGKLEKEKPEQIERFFKEELKKSQQGKESIFDYLSFFNWEGKTLKEGEEILKQRYERVKEKREVLEELRKYNFYFLIGDNSKREKIIFGFERLKEEDKKALLTLNKHISQLEKIRNYLSIFSLDDWVKLGKYSEFLDFDKEKIERKIKEKVKLDEIEDKKNHLVKEAIFSSFKENIRPYLEKLGVNIGEEMDKNVIINASLYQILEEVLKEVLEKIKKKKEQRDS